MNEIDKAALRQLHQELAQDIHVDEELLGDLYQEGVFEKSMIEIIQTEKTASGKIFMLLQLLPKRGPDALDKFIKTIEKNYDWLAKKLTKARKSISQKTIQTRPKNSELDLLKDQDQTPPFDKDIEKIVECFVRKSFRLGDNKKKKLVQFLSQQIQAERNRYQEILQSRRPSLESHGSIATGSEVSEKSSLKMAHMTSEPGTTGSLPESEYVEVEGHCHPECCIDIVLAERKSVHGRINYCTQHVDSDYRKHLTAFVSEIIEQCKALEEESLAFRQESKSLKNESQVLKETVRELKAESMENRDLPPLKHGIDIVVDETRTVRRRITHNYDQHLDTSDYQKHLFTFVSEVIDQCRALEKECQSFQCVSKALKDESQLLHEMVQALKKETLIKKSSFQDGQ